MMLFDESRKLLNFMVGTFNLEKLNSDTMKVAAFLAAVGRLDEKKIDHMLKGSAWDAMVEDVESAKDTFSAISAAKESSVPAAALSRFRLCSTKLDKERPLRLEEIKKKTLAVKSVEQEIPSEQPTQAICEALERKVAQISSETEAYCGANDRTTSEYKLFHTECDTFRTSLGNLSLLALAQTVEKLTTTLGSMRWNKESLSNSHSAFVSANTQATFFLNKFKSEGTVVEAYNRLESAIAAFNTLYSNASDDVGKECSLSALIDSAQLKNLTLYTPEAEQSIDKCDSLWKSIVSKKNFERNYSARISELQALIKKLKKENDSAIRVSDLNSAIDHFLAATMTFKNHKTFETTIDGIRQKYNKLNDEEKKKIPKWGEFLKRCTVYEGFLKKYRRKVRIEEWLDDFKDRFLCWLSTAWIPIVLAGVFVGVFFLMNADWYYNAPDWLLNHSVKLWGWRNWGTGTAFGITNALYHSGIFILFRIVLYIPTVIIDLLLYVLQAIWWVLVAISWPIRWVLSRLIGFVFYGLAYGLAGLLGVGACVGIGFCDFTYEKFWSAHIVNMVLCVGLTVLLYLLVFVLI